MMSEHKPGAGMRFWKKLTSALGMTMAEVLIVVAIVAVLAGLGVVGVWNYQRSLGQLERDNIAKEIFIAAQNHLTAMKGEGYLGKTLTGSPGTLDEDSGKKIYYYVVTRGNPSEKGRDPWEIMLPFGSIDDTVRRGGSYLIRYQPETATVLDVFYCTTSGTPTQFNHPLVDADYLDAMAVRDTPETNNKQARRYWGDGARNSLPILGWYGGADPSTLSSITLKAPTIEVNNGDTLTVTVTDNTENTENSAYTGKYSLKLIITGELSGAQKGVLLLADGSESRYSNADERLTEYTFTLDDITKANQHFSQMSSDTKDDDENEILFIPGENLKIQAVAYSSTNIANIAYSDIKTTNSLYADGTTANTAYISNIRHLENLDKAISHMDDNDTNNKLNITAAKQIEDLSWTNFWSNGVYYDSDPSAASPPPPVYKKTDDCFYPIEPDYSVTYDGQSHSITGVKAKGVNAGLFGSTTQVSEIKNLELIDFSITGSGSPDTYDSNGNLIPGTTGTAGALAGSLSGCTVTNVLAHNSSDTSTAKISAATEEGGLAIAGGLIGITDDTTVVQYSAAAVIVNGSSYAGGLIGKAIGTEINGCFSGGHTTDGDYEKWVNATDHSYDVTGTTAGGLVGVFSGSEIKYSYSTCSVSGATVGGFVGTAANTPKITNCYCTGLVNGEKAFIGSGSLDFGSAISYYYEIINAYEKGDGTIGYREPGDNSVTAKVTALDKSAATYNAFVGDPSTWKDAQPYDSVLSTYYSGKYNLRTVERLTNTTWVDERQSYFVYNHYGDWPSPELFFVNKPS